MPIALSPVTQLFNRLFTSKKGCLDSLPNDVLIDCVFVYLDIRDILRLRQVSQLYYHLTHHAVIWKRLLCESGLPLPPLPPTSRHNLENLSGLEVERLLTRAHSLDKIWRSKDPGLYDSWSFGADLYVAQMVLLPGSQYLVASVSDVTRQDWYIAVYVLDHRFNATQIARLPTKTKAYNLQAKYLHVRGENGITIAYVRRDWRRRGDGERGINISEYSTEHEIDLPYPVKYECVTMHISLKALEDLCDHRLVPGSQAFLDHACSLPGPFTQVSYLRSSRALNSLSLDDFAGQPFITLVRHPNDVIFKPLNGGFSATIDIQPYAQFEEFAHHIKAIRPLPQQQQILVAREILVPPDQNPYPITCLELHDMPIPNADVDFEEPRNPEEVVFLYDDEFSDIYFSEHGTLNWIDDSVKPTLPRGDAMYKPQPINMFCKTVRPSCGLLRITLYPQKTDNSVSPLIDERLQLPLQFHYRFTLEHTSPLRFVECHPDAQYRILPGSYRIMLYTIPWDDITITPSVLGFFRYHDDELFAEVPEELLQEEMGPEPLRRPVRRLPFNFEGDRFSSIAWDETTGRVCLAIPESTEVLVMDFSKRPTEDHFGRRMPVPVQQEHEIPMSLDDAPWSVEEHRLTTDAEDRRMSVTCST